METKESVQAIEVVQKPILKHRLVEIGKEVKERIEALQLDKQVATDETVQALKKLRAELNKESGAHSADLKTVLEVFQSPIDEVKGVFKAEITAVYANADVLLKDKIAFVELALKQAKKDEVKAYYEELCAVEKIDFIPFEKLGLDINLSTTAKKYKEQCLASIEKVVDDINLIKATEFEVEAMAEYKVGLNVSRAITTIKDRKEREKIELERKEKEAAQKLEQQRLRDIEAEAKKVEVLRAPEVIAPTQQAPTAEQLSNIVDIIVAQFECTGTREQLKSVGQFMRENNINYRNI
jgi:hypothetical protein